MSIERIEIDQNQVIDFVKHLEQSNPSVIANYLVMIVLETHLRKFLDESPIVGLDPITMQLIREITQKYPGIDTRHAGKFKGAVSKYLIVNGYAEKYFEFKPFN